MVARKTLQGIVAHVPKRTLRAILRIVIVSVVGVFCNSVFAYPVYTYSGEFDLRIPADPNSSKGLMYNAVIEIPDHLTIRDLDVGINLTHSNIFDLQIFLVSPSDTGVCLNIYNIDEFFVAEDYIGTIFDDEAELSIDEADSRFTGRFRPRDSLAAFNGEDAYGLWRLQIYDAYYADTGSLKDFSIIVTVIEPATAVLLVFGIGLAMMLRPR
jgi:subtilisin-like proprotein convertase family protein